MGLTFRMGSCMFRAHGDRAPWEREGELPERGS